MATPEVIRLKRMETSFRIAGESIRARLLAGLVVIVPLLLTAWVIRFLFNGLDGWLRPIEERYLGRHIPGTGVLATFVLVYLAGLLVTNLGGRHLLRWAEWLLSRLPLIGDVYGSSKQIMETISNPGGLGFRQVVAFDFPRPGVRALGFVTNETRDENGERLLAVFMPTTPNPTSGYLLLMRAGETTETSLTVDQALKMLVSGGVVVPPGFLTRPGVVREGAVPGESRDRPA